MQDTKNYIAAWQDYKNDCVVVVERDSEGKLYRKKYNCSYYFYVPDENGEFTSIFGDKLSKVEFSNKDNFESAKNKFPIKFESDFTPLKRILMDVYYGKPTPKINYAFLDIENNYSSELGWATTTNPYAEINAVTIYQSWTKKYFTYVLPPIVDGVKWTDIPGNTVDLLYAELNSLIEQKQLQPDVIPDIVICDSETELLQCMLRDLEPADIISGWNSEFFDIPYIAERLLLLGGEHFLAKMDYLGVKPPKKEFVDNFGSQSPVYTFTGKSYIDSLALFKKFTFEGRESYSLGNILDIEIGMGKLEYEGTLEQLYKNDFPKFTCYNFRDVSGLVQLDEKFKFIALMNQMAHENTVLFSAILGTVSYVETAITNHAHNVLNLIVHDKVIKENEKVEGAIVMTPKKGLHEWIGSVDISSLYPNTICSLNISPEKIVGQFTEKEQAWQDIFNKCDKRHTLILETGEQISKNASEWKDFLTSKKWSVSGYGTIFNQSEGKGVIPDILVFWYTERKRLQAEKKKWTKNINELKDKFGSVNNDEHLIKFESKFYTADELNQIQYAIKMEEQYDLLQLTKKISMNSLYGALLNAFFRFGDERMGASVTGSGRQITTHMIETIGFLLTGEKAKLIKTTSVDKKGKIIHEYTSDNEAIIYGDTDSNYFKTFANNKQEAIETADLVAEQVNLSFPQFMRDAFNCQEGFDKFIKAGREIVAERGLFQAKKKYICKVVDLEGNAVDKMKSMGSEIKKADTPRVIRDFLKSTVNKILNGENYDIIATYINQQRKSLLKDNHVDIFSMGVAKQVNNMDEFLAEYQNPGSIIKNNRKLAIPGHVRAACNYNYLLNIFEKSGKAIKSGDKIFIFYVKPNEYNFTAIAFPSDFTKFPQWFIQNFEVDKKLTEEKMFDNKLKGIFEALGKEVPTPQSVHISKLLEY